MRIGDRCFVHGCIDEIRKDTIIIKNKGGYFGTDPGEVIVENDTAHPNHLDCVSRRAAIDAVNGAVIKDEQQYAEDALKALPSAHQKEKQVDLTRISETKMKIVIDNYFKSECNTDTSIRQAFEKGFRIGVQKGITFQTERKESDWTPSEIPPEEEGGYLVTDDAGGVKTVQNDEFLHYEDGTPLWLYSQNVTAWRPLPEPYRGDNDG